MKSSRIPYQIFSITMAFLMLFTSVGFTVDMHYCQGELKTFSILGKAKSCHEIGQGMKNCPHHQKMLAEQKTANNVKEDKGCCSSKLLYFQSDQDQQLQAVDGIAANKTLQYFAIAFVDTFLKSVVTETDRPNYTHYKTPLIPRDIYVLLETYLL